MTPQELKSFRDTPGRYVYRGLWGVTAKTALGLIGSMRQAYPAAPVLEQELAAEQEFFYEELRKESQSNKLHPYRMKPPYIPAHD